MDVRVAGSARPASCLVTEIVPPLNSPMARRTDCAQPGLETETAALIAIVRSFTCAIFEVLCRRFF
jgi:hypothetical protein